MIKSGTRYAVNDLAKQFGVDRLTLTARLADAGIHGNKKVTIREAFRALTLKADLETARRRKVITEANLAEIELHKAVKNFIPVTAYRFIIGSLGVRVRQYFEDLVREKRLTTDFAREICNAIATVGAKVTKEELVENPYDEATCPQCRRKLFNFQPLEETLWTEKKQKAEGRRPTRNRSERQTS